MALHVVHEITRKEEWEHLRHLRYDGQEEFEKGRTRVDLYDEAKQTTVQVYCPNELLPDNLFWVN